MFSKKPIVIGNWKMNTNINEGKTLIRKIKALSGEIKNIEIVVCPPFVSLYPLREELNRSFVRIGAQDCFYEESGGYTGEISPLMVSEICHYVILGHSERRYYFLETDETVNKKIKLSLKSKLNPIICIGETYEEKKAGQTKKVITKQLRRCLLGLSKNDILKIIIAYEPVWAISSFGGKEIEDPIEIKKNIDLIRKFIVSNYGDTVEGYVRIIYGGSVNMKNSKEIASKTGVDGVLVGSASLNAKDFVEIIKSFEG